MYNIIAELQYVEANNCFLHLSSNIYSKLENSLSRCVKGLIIKSQSVIYLSLNAEVCRKLSDNVVGLSCLYASSLGLSQGDKVVLSPVDCTPSLSKLNTRPYSSDDHQILEISYSEVEASLLNQLRIVWPGQCFPIWVSPTITVRLVVENIYPDVGVGRLEQHTELIIGCLTESDRLIINSSENLDTFQTNDNSIVNSDIDESCLPIEPLVECLMVRLVPYETVDFPPYHVILSQDDCPDWLKSSANDTVYQLLNCSDPFTKVYVSVGLDASTTPDVGLYKTLNASQTVINHLSSSYGSKATLSPLKFISNELSSLLITPCPLLKKKHPLNEIENIFRKKLTTVCVKWGRCLLNTKGRFPLDNNTSVSITLRPLNLEWAQVTLISLYNLPISVTSFETSVSDELEESQHQSELSMPSKVVGSVLPEVNLLVEHSLGLKSGLVNKLIFRNNVLLVGKHSSGKSFISNHVLDIISRFPYYVHFEKIDCTALKGKRVENVGKIFTSHLNACKLRQPSVLLIEDMETICGTFSPELEKSEASFHTQRVSQKIAELLYSFSFEPSLLIFATCVSVTSINSALFKRRGKSIFSIVLPIQPLTQEERKQIIEASILNKSSNSADSLKDLDIDHFSSLTDSYVAGDLIKFIEKSIFEASQRFTSCQDNLVLIKEDLEKAFESSSEFINNKLKVQKHQDIKMSDVGGLKNVKEKLIEVILWPSKYSSLLNQCPLRKQNGVLIYGPPGCGKTLIARAIANESNLNFITVKGPELMSKYIGESEEGVRRVFENAQAAKPSLLFFDEFESLAPRRGEEQTGVTDRVVNQLLTALDGVEPISGVIVMAASSRPDLIDPALLRPGRLSHHLFCSYPNTEERAEILEKLTVPVILNSDVNLNVIAQLTEEFSGADLKGLLATAQILVLDRLADLNSLNESKDKLVSSVGPVTLTQADLLAALDQTQPSLSNKDRLFFSNIYKMFSKGKVPDVTNQRTIFA